MLMYSVKNQLIEDTSTRHSMIIRRGHNALHTMHSALHTMHSACRLTKFAKVVQWLYTSIFIRNLEQFQGYCKENRIDLKKELISSSNPNPSSSQRSHCNEDVIATNMSLKQRCHCSQERTVKMSWLTRRGSEDVIAIYLMLLGLNHFVTCLRYLKPERYYKRL